MQHPYVIAIGGLGGSGTRVVAEILRTAGFYVGATLNHQLDNLWFTLLFKRPEWFARHPRSDDIEKAIELFQRAMTVGLSTTAEARDIALLEEVVRQLESSAVRTGVDRNAYEAILASRAPSPGDHIGWGWKEPNTHVFLPQIAVSIEKLKYVHVIRHGLDMAVSGNQQQLENWSTYILGTKFDPDGLVPQQALDYWIAANRKAVRLGEELLGSENFLLLNYDRLCANPQQSIEEMLAFIEVDHGAVNIDALSQKIAPTTIGRHRQLPIGNFTKQQMDAVAEFGFDVSLA